MHSKQFKILRKGPPRAAPPAIPQDYAGKSAEEDSEIADQEKKRIQVHQGETVLGLGGKAHFKAF
jgi:hypothetical protein